MGIATAFGAPIGGLLFAFEELANSFSQALGWQIFFACMLAVLTLDIFKSAQHALRRGHFGLFDGDASTVFFEVRCAFFPSAAFLPSVVQASHRYQHPRLGECLCCSMVRCENPDDVV